MIRRAAPFVVVACWLAFAPPAGATFPGKNGALAYTGEEIVDFPCGDMAGHICDDTVANVFVTRIGGPAPTKLTDCKLEDGCGPTKQSWSPDGDLVAYDGPGGIVVARPDGGDAVLRIRGSEPCWSPDGRQIAYTSGKKTIVRRSLRGGPARKVASGNLCDWSARGLIAFIRAGTGREIWTVRPSGRGARRRLTEPPPSWTGFEMRSVSWSPGGLYLTYTSGGHVKIAPLGGGRVRTIAAGVAPAWSPDGKRIAFATEDGKIVARKRGGGGSTTLVPRALATSIAWQPLPRRRAR